MKIFVFLVLAIHSFLYCGGRSVVEDAILNNEIFELPPVAEADLDIESRAANCAVTVRGGIKNPSPLLVKPGTTQFYPFSATGVVEVAAGGSIEFHCNAGFAAPLSGKSVTGTCVGGTTFRIGGANRDMSEIFCSSWPNFLAKKSGSSCNGGTTLIDVGFQLDSSRFATQYQACFNEYEEVTRYIYHKLAPGNSYYANGVDRLTFAPLNFFGDKNVDKLYTQAVQEQTISKALGYDTSKYFDYKRNMFLSRGHLGAKADYMYAPEQRSTFLFINVAPQWQVFNAGNWQKVEDGLRDWITRTKKSVECWTGVWGVTTLPNKNGVETPLYLAYDRNNNGLIPVPKIYFRVVIEPATRKGIVFIGVNNPHLSLAQIQKDYILCPDVSDKVTWLSWKKTDLMAGYSYACEVPEFRKKVTHLPNFSVSGLLY